jgi:CheY-like chemotaxis protein
MLAGRADGPYVSITVTDSGSGIPLEIVDRIFEPFFTTKEIGKGTGLGLSTVFSIVKSHSGFLELRTEVGKGTTFELFFPGQVRHELARPEEPSAALAAARGEQLLLVDDEAGLLAMVKTTLETLGYQVLTASSGLEALDILAKRRPEIDLLLTDWQMPLMSGAELVRKVQAAYPDLKIIVGTVDMVGANELSALSVQGVLQKPYTTDAMLKALREVFASGNVS